MPNENTKAYCVKKLKDGTLIAQLCPSPFQSGPSPMDVEPKAVEYVHVMATNGDEAIGRAREEGWIPASMWISGTR